MPLRGRNRFQNKDQTARLHAANCKIAASVLESIFDGKLLGQPLESGLTLPGWDLTVGMRALSSLSPAQNLYRLGGPSCENEPPPLRHSLERIER